MRLTGINPGSLKKFWTRGGENVEKLKLIIKLVEALTNFVRAITDLVQTFKA